MSSKYDNPFVAVVTVDEDLRIHQLNKLAEVYFNSVSRPGEISYLHEKLTGCDKKKWLQQFHANGLTGQTFEFNLQSADGGGQPHQYKIAASPQGSLWVVYFIRTDQAPSGIIHIQDKLDQLKREERHYLDLKLELQMTDIALERKSYELALIRDLLKQIKSLQDYDEIIHIFMKFICEKFLLGHGFFIKIFTEHELRGHVSSSYSLMETPNLAGLRQKIFDIIVENPKYFVGTKKYWKAPVPEALAEYFNIPGKNLSGVLHLPIYHKSELLGILQMAHYEPHHGLSKADVDFIDVLLEQIEPFIENSKLFEMSMVDDLTQVYNKRYFNLSIEREFKKAKSNPGMKMNLMMLDIDFFKKVNDTYGHLAGDKVLQEFSKILKTSTRDKDILCRYGGEEFAVLILEPFQVAKMIADRVMHRLHNAVIDLDGGIKKQITTSIGICSFNPSFQTPSEWIKATDQSLYEAKKTGRDKVVIHKFSTQESA